MFKRFLSAAACGVAALLLTSCGSVGTGKAGGDGPSTTVQAGSTKVSVQKPIKLAYFAPGTSNAWLQSSVKSVKAAVAKIPNAEVTVFDAKWDGTTQFNQVQNALQSKRFNAAVIDPINDQVMCDIISKKAPAAGVVVSVIAVPLCGKALAAGEAQYQDGTLNYIGGTDSADVFARYIDYMAEQNPGPQKVVALSGPKLFGVTKNLEKAIADAKSKHPDFQFLSVADTDYSLAQGQAKLAPLLQANPDVSVVFSAANSDVTQGAYQSLKAAGKLGKVKLYDKGGSTWAIERLRAGELAASSPYHPATMATKAVESIAAAFDGQKVPVYLPNDGATLGDNQAVNGFEIIDKAAAADFTPEY